ncbi:hypothetical protein BDR26DRAFT_949340 [Obelidium mucronatum]|nr:hypothetical protein BDR26DRAFT_949340 [Obelidium mucronatum]
MPQPSQTTTTANVTDPANYFILLMIIISGVQLVAAVASETVFHSSYDDSTEQTAHTTTEKLLHNQSKKTATSLILGNASMLLAHLSFYLKLQHESSNPTLYLVLTIIQVLNISIAETCCLLFAWILSKGILKAYLRSCYITPFEWFVKITVILIFLQHLPKVIQWATAASISSTTSSTSDIESNQLLPLATKLSSGLAAIFILGQDLAYLIIFSKILSRHGDSGAMGEGSEFAILARYGVAAHASGCLALAVFIVATAVLGSGHVYYNLVFDVAYMFLNVVFVVFMAMQVALRKRRREMEGCHDAAVEGHGGQWRQRMANATAKLLPSVGKNNTQKKCGGAVIGGYTAPFSTIPEGSSVLPSDAGATDAAAPV